MSESYSDEELINNARDRAFEGLLMCVSIKDSPQLRSILMRYFQDALATIDVHSRQKASLVTPEVLGEDVVDVCDSQGWDTTLLFWEGDRYDDDDEEIPSDIAVDIARRLLERYEMKPRT
jgi:hypothetical protein